MSNELLTSTLDLLGVEPHREAAGNDPVQMPETDPTVLFETEPVTGATVEPASLVAASVGNVLGKRRTRRLRMAIVGLTTPGIMLGGAFIPEAAHADDDTGTTPAVTGETAPTAEACAKEDKPLEKIGHRGGGVGLFGNAAEDTIESAKAALRTGVVDTVENDIQQMEQDVPVMHHDTTWNRMTNWSGVIRKTAPSMLKKIRNIGGFKVAKMVDYIKTMAKAKTASREPAGIILENKQGLSNDVFDQEVAAVQKYFGGTGDRVTVSASEAGTLAKLKDKFKKVGMDCVQAALIMRGKREWKDPNKVNPNVIDFLNVDEEAITAARVRAAHNRGFLVSARNVNSPAIFRKMKAAGVDRVVMDLSLMSVKARSAMKHLSRTSA